MYLTYREFFTFFFLPAVPKLIFKTIYTHPLYCVSAATLAAKYFHFGDCKETNIILTNQKRVGINILDCEL